MKSIKYGIVHAYAQCSNCDWDATLDINSTSRMSKLRVQIKRHVEKEGHKRQEIAEAILNELHFRRYNEAIANGCNEKDAMTLADNWDLYKDAQTLFKFYVDLAIVSERFIKLESCENLGDTFIRFDEKNPIEQWRRIDEMLEEEGLKVINPNLNAR